MSAPVAWAVVVGVTLGFGLWMLVSLAPRLGRPTLATRIAPYVVDLSSEARDLLQRTTANPLPVFGMLFEPVMHTIQTFLDHLIGGTEITEKRLRQAGLNSSAAVFRSRQVIWAVLGAVAAIIVVVVVGMLRPVAIPVQIVGVLTAALGGFIGRDALLKRQAAARSSRIAAELPTILEFLTLSLSAGEGILDALRRVSRVSRGELAGEIATVTTAVAAGLPLATTLTHLAGQLQLPAFTRAVEQIAGALERGSPLAEVLRSQAQDSREESKRDLLEMSGKKEVAMLVPLVFLILPMTVLFALLPGIFVLQIGL